MRHAERRRQGEVWIELNWDMNHICRARSACVGDGHAREEPERGAREGNPRDERRDVSDSMGAIGSAHGLCSWALPRMLMGAVVMGAVLMGAVLMGAVLIGAVRIVTFQLHCSSPPRRAGGLHALIPR